MRNPPPNNRQCLAGQRGGGFPAHAKRPAPSRSGHLCVRYAERYNALDLAPRWGCKVVRPGTPRHPGLRLRSCLEGRALPPFLPPCGAAETRPRGGTGDEGRGVASRKIGIKISACNFLQTLLLRNILVHTLCCDPASTANSGSIKSSIAQPSVLDNASRVDACARLISFCFCS